MEFRTSSNLSSKYPELCDNRTQWAGDLDKDLGPFTYRNDSSGSLVAYKHPPTVRFIDKTIPYGIQRLFKIQENLLRPDDRTVRSIVTELNRFSIIFDLLDRDVKTTRNDINKIRLKYLIKFFPFLFIAVFFKIDDFQNIFRNSLNISQTRNLELRPLDEFLSESILSESSFRFRDPFILFPRK